MSDSSVLSPVAPRLPSLGVDQQDTYSPREPASCRRSPVHGRAFRALAIAEAGSWVGLLIGMFVTYIAVQNEIGVQIFGPIHGVLFIAYVVAAVAAARPLRWDRRTLLLAPGASVPPLCTLWFERWALRTGRLVTPQLDRVVPAA